MAFFEINNITLKGITACVPENIEENIDIPVFVPGEAQRVISQTGIERKRVSPANIAASDLYGKAGEILIKELNWEKDTIDVLMVVSLSPDYTEPPTACIMQDRLGLSENCLTLDLNQGCPGWIDGLAALAGFMSATGLKRGLLLNGDVSTKLSSPLDKECRPLFGDAGAATALEYNLKAPSMQFETGTRGSGFKSIWRKAGGVRVPLTPESLEMKSYGENILRRDIDCKMDGMDVFAFGISQAPKSVRDLMEKYSLDYENIDKFIFHQANNYMNTKIRKKLNLPLEKVPMALKDFGNTSSASIPLTMVTQCNKDYQEKKLETIACAFGVGLAWGSVHFITDRITCPDLIIFK